MFFRSRIQKAISDHYAELVFTTRVRVVATNLSWKIKSERRIMGFQIRNSKRTRTRKRTRFINNNDFTHSFN